MQDKIFLDDSRSKQEGTAKTGIPGPIHLVRRGDYLCGLVREYEENRRALIEQNALIAKMPVREGYGFEQPSSLSAIKANANAAAGPSSSKMASAATQSPSVASSSAHHQHQRGSSAVKQQQSKRRKTPEYTDSEGDSECVQSPFSLPHPGNVRK